MYNNATFDQALLHVRCGHRIRRAAWPNNHYIYHLFNHQTHSEFLMKQQAEKARQWNVRIADLLARDWVLIL